MSLAVGEEVRVLPARLISALSFFAIFSLPIVKEVKNMSQNLFAVLYGAVQEFVDTMDEETREELKEELFKKKYQKAEQTLELRRRLRELK